MTKIKERLNQFLISLSVHLFMVDNMLDVITFQTLMIDDVHTGLGVNEAKQY